MSRNTPDYYGRSTDLLDAIIAFLILGPAMIVGAVALVLAVWMLAMTIVGVL